MKDDSLIHARGGTERLLWRGLALVVLPLSFRTFQFFPGMSYVQEAWFAFSFLVLVTVYPYFAIRRGLIFSRFEVYLLMLMVVSVSVAAWQAHRVFGQPVIYGILSQRDVAVLGIWLVMLNLLNNGIAEIADIEAILITLSWATFALFATMRLFLSPSNFLAYGEGLVTRPMIGIEPSFKLQEFFILFGVFYYAILGIRKRQIRYYLLAAVLFPVTLGGSGRGIAVCAAVTLTYFLYRLRGLRGAVLAGVQFLIVACATIIIVFAISPATLSARIRGFSDAFSAVFTGSVTQDPSANARILETFAATPYIQAHPILGNGIVSHQWNGGSETAMGAYFFASDIGIVGILFSYGVLGLLLFLWQYRFAWTAAKELPASQGSPLLDATKALLLYSAIYSLESGMFVWSANVTLFFVVLLYGISAHRLTPRFSRVSTGDSCDPQRPALSA